MQCNAQSQNTDCQFGTMCFKPRNRKIVKLRYYL